MQSKYIGNQYGRLLVISRLRVGRKTYCECKCECGNVKSIRQDHLQSGGVVSCGCFRSEAASANSSSHKSTGSPEYVAWSHMRQRCTNKNSADYADYGGRGVKVCDSWMHSFTQFLSDMGVKPSPKHSIDRIDVNGDYDPANCRWATSNEQARNKRSSRVICAFGETKSIHEWAEEIGVTALAIWKRLERGMHPEAALRLPKYARGFK